MNLKKIFFLVFTSILSCYLNAQSTTDENRQKFDFILYSPISEKEKIQKFKTEIPKSFYSTKGFYMLTKAVEQKSTLLIDFVLSVSPNSINESEEYTKENILSYLPWSEYSIVKAGTCILTDTLISVRISLCKYLISKGANLNYVSSSGNNVMGLAIYRKDLGFLKFLYESNNNKFVNIPDENLLYKAANIGCTDILYWLIEKGEDINIPNKYEGSVIGRCVTKPDVVKFLLEKGAIPDLTKPNGWTALMYAIENGNIESMKLLLDAGADMTKLNQNGWDVFKIAKYYKQKKALKFLKNYKKN